MNSFHTPIFLKEIIDLLQIKKNKKYIDATLGGGGHTERILEKQGLVLGIDADEEAIIYVKNKNLGKNLTLIKGNFRDLEKIAHSNNFDKVSGILFDLGVSSHQIDTPSRGFSFLKAGPLDMRMDKDSGVTAETLINVLEKGELYDLFNKLGQEHRSRAVSNSIISARRVKAIRTTDDLVKVIQKAYGIREGEITDFTKNDISRKVFQALRIAVNTELENITEALPKALELLEDKGRIAVISFHSLEDGIVKKAFKDFEKRNMGKIITKKPMEASIEEKEANPRSKSAKLRIFEKK